MGLILDSSVHNARERDVEMLADLLLRMQAKLGERSEDGHSALNGVGLTTLSSAQIAARIEEEQALEGITIASADLVLDATALCLGFDGATLDVRHLQHGPSLTLVTIH